MFKTILDEFKLLYTNRPQSFKWIKGKPFPKRTVNLKGDECIPSLIMIAMFVLAALMFLGAK